MASEVPRKDSLSSARVRARALGLSNLLIAGAVAGLVAGLAFVLANMAYANAQGMPAVAPFADIATVFFFADEPSMNAEFLITGLVTHLALSIAFGVAFALLVPLFANVRSLMAAGVAYGLALYVVNFQILGRILFDWFSPTNPEGPSQVFELIIHPAVFGLLLVPFFAGMVARLQQSASNSNAALGDTGTAAGRVESLAG